MTTTAQGIASMVVTECFPPDEGNIGLTPYENTFAICEAFEHSSKFWQSVPFNKTTASFCRHYLECCDFWPHPVALEFMLTSNRISTHGKRRILQEFTHRWVDADAPEKRKMLLKILRIRLDEVLCRGYVDGRSEDDEYISLLYNIFVAGDERLGLNKDATVSASMQFQAQYYSLLVPSTKVPPNNKGAEYIRRMLDRDSKVFIQWQTALRGCVPWIKDQYTSNNVYLPYVIMRHVLNNGSSRTMDFETLALFLSRRSPSEIHTYTTDTEQMSRFFADYYETQRVLSVTSKRLKSYRDLMHQGHDEDYEDYDGRHHYDVYDAYET